MTLGGPGGSTSLQTTITVNPAPAFTATIAIVGPAPVNLRTLANAAGYDGNRAANVIFTLASNVSLLGNPGEAAIDTGVWPTGSYPITLALQISGTVCGGGGNGGAGNGGVGGNGGDAIVCRLPLSVSVAAGSQVQAGGGGGGGGQEGSIINAAGDPVSLGGGGGGGGFPNGRGGPGGTGDLSGSAGSNGTTVGGGTGGGAGGASAGAGGAGGAPAGVGARGGGSNSGFGGQPGFAVRKNGNTVNVTNNGLIVGAQG